MSALPFDGDARLRTAVVTSRWFTHLQLWRPTASDHVVTDDVESAAVLLSGTFDLHGGPTAWPSRGARKSEFAGRPMAVFLPPRTTFRAENGSGEIVILGARQPSLAGPPKGREALGHKPLLPLAGSGKSFDPNSGEWRPAETFPTAPESLPPRRMQRIACGPLTVERVIAEDYKAATLSIDEVVLEPGRDLALRDLPAKPACDEILLFVRTEGEAMVGATQLTELRGDGVFLVPQQQFDTFSIRAIDDRTYVLIAYAGKH